MSTQKMANWIYEPKPTTECSKRWKICHHCPAPLPAAPAADVAIGSFRTWLRSCSRRRARRCLQDVEELGGTSGPSKPSTTPAGSGSDPVPSWMLQERWRENRPLSPLQQCGSQTAHGSPLCETVCGSEAEPPEEQNPGQDTWVGRAGLEPGMRS